jgi:hypothetical protein
MRSPLALSLALLLGAALAQQPEQAHLAMTGKPGELSLDFMAHAMNCSLAWGAQLATSPDFTEADFVPASGCVDFTAQEPSLTLAVQVLFTGLVPGTQYYYVCGTPDLKVPWSQVYSFTYGTGSLREGGPVYAVLADFGDFNSESLYKLEAEAFAGRYDALLHAGDFAVRAPFSSFSCTHVHFCAILSS